MIGAAACLVLGLTPGTSAAQEIAPGCKALVEASSYSGQYTPGIRGITYDTSCYANVTVRTEVWITQFSSLYCMDGSTAYGAACKIDAADWAQATGIANGYGYYDGWVKGIFRVDGDWNELPLEHRTLYAGQPIRGGNDPLECEEWEQWSELEGRCIPYNSPIVIPLTRAQAIKLTSLEAGVLFDIDGDGKLEQVSWTAADSKVAFLALDRNGNGVIDNGKELFGDNTLAGSPNGFAALARMAQESAGGAQRGSVSLDDPLFIKLLLWEDRNHNGISEASELQPAANILSDIGLGYQEHQRRDGHGNLFRYRGYALVRTAPGRNQSITPAESFPRRIDIYDVFFKVQR